MTNHITIEFCGAARRSLSISIGHEYSALSFDNGIIMHGTLHSPFDIEKQQTVSMSIREQNIKGSPWPQEPDKVGALFESKGSAGYWHLELPLTSDKFRELVSISTNPMKWEFGLSILKEGDTFSVKELQLVWSYPFDYLESARCQLAIAAEVRAIGNNTIIIQKAIETIKYIFVFFIALIATYSFRK